MTDDNIESRAQLVYYNEFDPKAVEWLQELIRQQLIPNGVVDARSICDVQPNDVRGYRQCHFFAGIAGWSLALQLAGWPDDRQVWTGSCPCQPYSSAGKGEGDNDPRNLWPDFFRLIRECRPECVFGEQVEAAIRHGWLDGVCRDLEGEGYAVGQAILGAHGVLAPHIRQRLYWCARRTADELADTGCGGFRDIGFKLGGPPQGVGGEVRQQRVRDDARHGSDSGGVDDSTGYRTGRLHKTESGSNGAYNGLSGSASAGGGVSGWPNTFGRLGDSYGEPGPERNVGAAGGVVAPHRADARGSGLRNASSWAEFAVVHCRDGKTRRFEPCSFPLAHGIPKELGPLLAVLERMGVDPKTARRLTRNARSRLAKAGRNCVDRLKGYGNAIVPELAAAFVSAFMEAT